MSRMDPRYVVLYTVMIAMALELLILQIVKFAEMRRLRKNLAVLVEKLQKEAKEKEDSE